MKKVGIITIIDYNNYGNRLQNYATQRVLETLGLECETILNFPTERLTFVNRIKRLKEKKINEIFPKVFNYACKKVINSRKKFLKTHNEKIREFEENRIASLNNQRISVFKTFSNEYINETTYCITPNSIPLDLGVRFDFFVVGSDQVWNPNYMRTSHIDFLSFAPKNKRVALSPSFGVSAIPSNYEEKYKSWISEFKSLSVREDAGSEIIRDLTGREAIVLVDPTLMLTKDEWISISKPAPQKPLKSFILTYFLGELSKEAKVLIKKLSKDNNLEVVNLGSYEQIERYATDPREFIDYINSAHIFLTDSFHGVVFSIILGKQFIVFDRISKVPSMNSRINTLLAKFKMMDRKWESVKQSQDYFGADFSHTGLIFEEEKSKAFTYLRSALDIEDMN